MFDVLGINKQLISAMSQSSFETYESATNEVIEELKLKLDKLKSELDSLTNELGNIEATESDKEGILDQMSWILDERATTAEHLAALEEMKIVYLFKSLEMRIKSLIKTAYPEHVSKEAYKWETMKNLFKNFDIDITTLEGYKDAFDLNKLNNCIKHSGEISDDIKAIKEFRESMELDFEKLKIFHSRVRMRIEDFIKALGQAIINDLYNFDEKRIDKICMAYANRMNKETAQKFIEVFNNKLQEKSEAESVLEQIKRFQNFRF